jgi:catechol 2,3-dioxygenase-like lactoylglutathione lyase family enzyme
MPTLGLLVEGVHYDGKGPSYDDRRRFMNWTLEVVWVPVSDVDHAKAFYAEQLGFNVDHDTQVSEGNRIVQLTPPGSGCSIVIGEGTIAPEMPPGSLKGLQLVVPDIHAAHAQLGERGVEVGEIQVMGENPRPQPDPLDNVGFVFFSDPDGNGWAVQQISARG